MQNQTLSELYTDDNKSKYSSNLKDIFKSEKKSYEKLYTKETTSIATTIEFPSNILIRQKISNEKINLFVAKISLYEIMKSITFQTNNKSPGSASRIAELYKHLSNELSPVLLDIQDYRGNLGTMGVTSRTGISVIYSLKNLIERILQTIDRFHFKIRL